MQLTKSRASDRLVNNIKTLAIDAVDAANSGHPGMPLGMAEASAVLWADFLNVTPDDPAWRDRDRFVLSAGHGSALLYALLHLAGYDLPMDELRRFRQLHSRTPGHPEFGVTPGVETTTGPLGAGISTAVGMAMAEAHLAARFNRPGHTLVDHWTYGICSDGDLQEGIAAEAVSLAGHLGLGKLVFLYDDNHISIEGDTDLSFSEDVPARFRAYGWHVTSVDGHDRDAVHAALAEARAMSDKPSLIACRTTIGRGSPSKAGKASSHGSPLGAKETALVKQSFGWDPAVSFFADPEAVAAFDDLRTRGAARKADWEARAAAYAAAFPELWANWQAMHASHTEAELIAKTSALVPAFGDAPVATRVASGKVLNALAPHFPGLWGGSADLASSTKTLLDGEKSFSRAEPAGRNLHFGIREHAMGAIMNGVALHGGLIPYGATFLTFSDYMRGSMRLSALMGVRAVYVLTHDSIFLGEDGPTHQSVEHAQALRLIPNLEVIRPGDARETAWAWVAALSNTSRPTALLLTRQDIPGVPGTGEGVLRGGYVVVDAPSPRLVLVATGSELHVAIEAAETLTAEGVACRVVSMPSLERFLSQPEDYRASVLPASAPVRLVVEAGRTVGWERIAGPFGDIVGIDRFGESAPAEVLAEVFGVTTAAVTGRARALLEAFPARAAAMRAVLGA
jgi:transketolase